MGAVAKERQSITESDIQFKDYAADLLEWDSPGMLESSPEAGPELEEYRIELAGLMKGLEERKSAAGVAVSAEIAELRTTLRAK